MDSLSLQYHCKFHQQGCPIFKGLLADSQFCHLGLHFLANGWSGEGFNILVLIPPTSSAASYTSHTIVSEGELLLGQSLENLTKVNTSSKINMDLTAPLASQFVQISSTSATSPQKFKVTRPSMFWSRSSIQLP